MRDTPLPETSMPTDHPFAGAATIVFITLDTLRFDAADEAFRTGRLPNLANHMPTSGWERRHSPASFTYAAHHAFFSGFLPTPTTPGSHPRLYAASFAGSETSTATTYVFPQATLPEALAEEGYTTICIGGTGFFNRRNALGSVLPSLFHVAHWDESLGVTDRRSPSNQVTLAIDQLTTHTAPVFLFINVSAIHQPNWFYGVDDPADRDSADPPVDDLASHTAALCAFDAALPPLFEKLKMRGQAFCILCSDHGTAYGEDGFFGHRHGQPVIWDVPYTEFSL